MKNHIKTLETENETIKLFIKEKLYVIKNESVLLNKENRQMKTLN